VIIVAGSLRMDAESRDAYEARTADNYRPETG
jgi:hypothetical protein